MINEENVKIYKERNSSFIEKIQKYLKLIQTLLLLGIFIFSVLIWMKIPSSNITKISNKDMNSSKFSSLYNSMTANSIPVEVVNTPNVIIEDVPDNLSVEVENFSDLEISIDGLFDGISEEIEEALNGFSLVNINPFPVEIKRIKE